MDQRLINAKENSNKIVEFVKTNYKIIFGFLFGLFILYWMMFILTPKVGMSPEDRAKIE